MEEFLRKCVSRRLLALSEGEFAALTTSMRQIGVCTPGGAEALAIFHQLLYDEWMTGSLSGPLARIKVDEKRCASRRRDFSPSTRQQQQHGNFGTCLMLNKKGSRQCRRFGVQSKETSMVRCSAAWLWEWWRLKRAGAQLRSKRQAASHGLVWRIHHRRTAIASRPRNQSAAISQLPAWRPGADDPQRALQKNVGLADLWYVDDGDIMCHPILVPSFLQEFDVGNAKVGAARKPQKAEVRELDATPLEWRILDVQNSYRWKHHTRSRCRPSTNSKAKQRSFEPRTNAFCQDPQTEFARTDHMQKSTTRLGSGLSNGSSQISRRTV